MNEKRVVQDIVPGKKRTIRNLSVDDTPPPRPRSKKLEKIDNIEKTDKTDRISRVRVVEDDIEEVDNRIIEERLHRGSTRKKRVWGTLLTFLIIFVGVAIIATAASLLYLKAVITVVPKVADIDVSGTFTAMKDAKFPDLSYEVIIATSSTEQSVPATSGPAINTKASGTLYLYNEQTNAQTLLTGTRIASIPSIVYRTVSTAVIPKATTVNGKLIPGSISVKIVADQAGSNYNAKITDSIFNILAFKGTDRYGKVYGKMKTDIVGGFKGNKEIIPKDIEKTAIDSMKDSLKTKLLDQVKRTIKSDHIFFPNAYNIEYNVLDPVKKDDNYANLTVVATMYAMNFKNTSFVKFVADKDMNKFPSTEYDIQGLDKLSFSIINQKDFSLKSGTPVNFILKGRLVLTGKFNQEDLKNKLKGIKLTESPTVFGEYKAIDNAYSRISPFWMRSYPNSIKDITIEIKH